MKSKFFLFALSAVALTACTSEDVVNDVATTKNAIGFENVVKKVSRAEDDLTTSNLTHFNVFGYYTTPQNPLVAIPVFEDVDVKLDKTEREWYYDKTRYWIEGGHYYFFAYSCGSVSKIDQDLYKDIKFSMDMTNNKAVSDRVLIIHNYICDNSHQHDLIYASNTGATAEDPWHGIVAKGSLNPDVAFQFKHILAKANAKFTSKFPSGYKVTISDISLQNIRNQGTYNPINEGVWQDVIRKNDATNYVYLLNTDDKNVQSITTSSDDEGVETPYAFVIPYQYTTSASDTEETGITLKFKIVVTNKDEIIFEQKMTGKIHPNWQAGYRYTYNVELSGASSKLQAIVFTTAKDEDGNDIGVIDWANGTDDPTVTIE